MILLWEVMHMWQIKAVLTRKGKADWDTTSNFQKIPTRLLVGLNNPWSKWGTKYEDVLIEGQTVTSKQEAKDFTGEYEVEVTDGELNVFVQATPGTRKDKNGDPVLNYIIVRAIPEGEVSALEVLQEQINSYKDKVGDGSNYSEETLKVFYEAIAGSGKTDSGAVSRQRSDRAGGKGYSGSL